MNTQNRTQYGSKLNNNISTISGPKRKPQLLASFTAEIPGSAINWFR